MQQGSALSMKALQSTLATLFPILDISQTSLEKTVHQGFLGQVTNGSGTGEFPEGLTFGYSQMWTCDCQTEGGIVNFPQG